MIQIEIGLCNVSFVPLYGVDIKQKILALFSPEETLKGNMVPKHDTISILID